MKSKIYNLNLLSNNQITEIGKLLKQGKVGILPTDTIYGIHTNPFNQNSVEQIFSLKRRSKAKPFIILIASIADLKLFGIKLKPKELIFLNNLWPNPVSVILPVKNPQLTYLHQGLETIAFRIPKFNFLKKVLKISGPLISTSANLSGMLPAKNIDDAILNFQNRITFYINGGELHNLPSTVLKLENDKLVVLREGGYKMPNKLLAKA